MKLSSNWLRIKTFQSFRDFLEEKDKSMNYILKWVDPVKKQVALSISGHFDDKKDALNHLKISSSSLDLFELHSKDVENKIDAIQKWDLKIDVIPRSKAIKFFDNLFNTKYLTQDYKIYLI